MSGEAQNISEQGTTEVTEDSGVKMEAPSKSEGRLQTVILALLGVGLVAAVGLLAFWFYSSRIRQGDTVDDQTDDTEEVQVDSDTKEDEDESDTDASEDEDESETEISTDGWETYVDTVYNYTVKYPPTWSVEETPAGGGVASLTGKHDSDSMSIQISKHDEKVEEDESLAIFEERRTTDIFGNEAYEGVEPVDESYVTIANMKTYRKITEMIGEDGYSVYYVFAKESDAFFFNWYALDYEEHLDYAEAILDTFEFASK